MLAAAQIASHGATSTPSFDSPGSSLGTSNSENAKQAPQQQPPALPGATRSPAGAAPASKPPTDLSPNDALFDAINRGDIDVARDAIARGADLDARNLLGMTPMELSVDLGRNDISFLLLSYRGGGSGSQGQPRVAGSGPEAEALRGQDGEAGPCCEAGACGGGRAAHAAAVRRRWRNADSRGRLPRLRLGRTQP